MNVAREECIRVLQTGRMPSSQELGAPFALHHQPEGSDAVDPSIASEIQAIAAAGALRVSEALIAQLPNLKIIANFGVGYDRVDVASATRRGVVVTNTPDVLTEEVADFTLGLMIAAVRRIPAADAFVRTGAWERGPFPLSASLRGRRIGILGMGRIGAAIATRCRAMGLKVAYHARRPRAEAALPYHPSALALAEASDVLIVIVPGGPETEGLVDARVLAALGPNGVLVNVARGSVVDEAALVAALSSGGLLGAGLDVFADEPRVPAALRALDNVVLCPHAGSATTATRAAMGDLVFANIRRWFETGGALNPVNLTELAGA